MASEGLTALREVSQLSVEISELLGKPGTSKRLQFSEEVHGLGLDVGRVEPFLEFDLRLDSLVEGVLVSGQVRGVYAFDCIRCLRSFEQHFAVEMSEVLAYEGQEGAEEGYQIAAAHAHLEPVVRDAVVLAMPLHPLCRPDCKGLCPVCGSDRNTVDCGHKAKRTDLRWEPLASLKETLGGSGGSGSRATAPTEANGE